MRHAVVSRNLLCLAAMSLTALAQYGCAAAPRVAAAASSTSAGDGVRRSDDLPGAPRTIVRRYAGAPSTTVIGWSTNEAYQGLRSSVRGDGSLVRDHHIFVSAYAVPSTASLAYGNSNWYAFSNGMKDKAQLELNGVLRDQFNCDGTDECTPLVIYSARVPDVFLRASRDSVVVKMQEVNGMSETLVTLHADMVTRYLAVVDSVSTVRRKAIAAR